MNQTTKKADTAKVSKIDPNYKAPAGRSNSSNATVELLRTPIKGVDKVPPQMGKIIEALRKAKGNTLSVRELIGENESGLNSALDAVGLETVQTAPRIWSFYRKRLINDGFISIS